MKKILSIVWLLCVGIWWLALASEISGELNPNIEQGLEVDLACSPSSVSNGSVNQENCQITCDSGYDLDEDQCVRSRSSGGGWWWATREKDYCPNGDTSGSFYDGRCISNTTGWTGTISSSNNDDGGSIGVCLDQEYQAAYTFALQYSITTMPTCLTANMDGLLIRAHAAKMISNYAMNVLKQEPNTDKVCTFNDMDEQPLEMQTYAQIACQLGLMGLETDGVTPSTSFNPTDYLDKAQFATILSRLLYGEQYNGNTTCWYCDHVAALQDAGVITVITDLFDPLKRAFAMIMLMRTQQ